MKTIFLIRNLEMGGVQRSLINLTEELQNEGIEITYYIINFKGDLIKKIPLGVKVIRADNMISTFNYLYTKKLKEIIEKKKKKEILIKFLISFLARIKLEKLLFKVFSVKTRFTESYDLAISFDGIPSISDYIVKKKFPTSNKIAWIHSDPILGLNLNEKLAKKKYRAFDSLVFVSNSSRKKFLKLVPMYKEKSFVVNNTFPIRKIIDLSDEFNPYIEKKELIFVTVARMENNSKRIDKILNSCIKLKEEKITNFCWYVVGDGPDLLQYRKIAENHGIKDIIIFVGNKENPYPYIKHADLFVLSSKYEGYPLVLKEALILNTPVLTTGFSSAKEIIEHNVTGIITENKFEDFYINLKNLIINKKEIEKFKNNIKNIESSNSLAIKQFNYMTEYLLKMNRRDKNEKI